MSTGLLQGKVVLLTGGSTGIGWNSARAYAASKAAFTRRHRKPARAAI